VGAARGARLFGRTRTMGVDPTRAGRTRGGALVALARFNSPARASVRVHVELVPDDRLAKFEFSVAHFCTTSFNVLTGLADGLARKELALRL
jgi:hypothetical protein